MPADGRSGAEDRSRADESPRDDVTTRLVHLGRPPREPGAPVNLPLDASSTFHAGGPVEYSRYGTPGMAALESVVGDLEGGHAIAFSSGMAAANAVVDTMPVGCTVVAPDPCYAGVGARLRSLDATGRIRLRPVDPSDIDATVSALEPGGLLWLESPGNPLLDVVDIAALAAQAHRRNVVVVCDNTFATPLLQRPLALGADIVVHSATKLLGGHSDLLLGLVVVSDDASAREFVDRRTLLGSTPGSLEAFLALRGVRTLGVRLERSERSAATIAARLAEHPAVTRVRYPGLVGDPGHTLAAAQMSGFGSMLAIEVAGGAEAAQHLCEATRLWVHATSLGGVESLLERRRRWAMESPRVPESLVRLSVGIEDPEDLWSDLDRALREAHRRSGAG